MNRERAAGLIFIFAGTYGLIFSTQLPIGRWDEPGPGGFPLSISILLCLSGVLTFILGKSKGEKEEGMDWRKLVEKLITPIKILGITLAFILVLERMGYLLASSIFLFLLFLWVSRYRLWVAMSLAIVVGSGSWYFFGKILAVQLPQGFLPL